MRRCSPSRATWFSKAACHCRWHMGRRSGEVEAGMFSGLLQRAQMSINAEGFIEAPGEDTNQWVLNLKSFDGKVRFLDRVNSACRPTSEFVSEQEFLMTACDVFAGWDVVAISNSGNRIWGIMSE